MDRVRATSWWVNRGIRECYFAFLADELEDHPFWEQTAFHNIMAVELLIKSVVILERGDEYEGLSEQEAKEKIDEIARSVGHNLGAAFDVIRQYMRGSRLDDLLDMRKFDGLRGSELVAKVLEPAYEETRYPTPNPLHLNFKIRQGAYHYPIASSAIGDFTRALASIVLTHLGKSGHDFGKLKDALGSMFASDGGKRFVNVTFGGNYVDKIQSQPTS